MRSVFLSAFVMLGCLLPLHGQAQALATASAQASATAWGQALEARNISVSALLMDPVSGRVLDEYKADQALLPASTTKVVTTWALLKTWKPDYVIETEVWGALNRHMVTGDLVFKGAGDPVLTSERLWLLGERLREKGITRVVGRVRLDQGAFDTQRYGDGWEDTSRDETPPILPLSVNWNRDEKGRIDHDPEPLAVKTITRILKECGIEVLGREATGGEPVKLGSITSPPLRELVQSANKYSNNFLVEMLVKRFGDGKWATGVQRIQGFYRDNLGLGPDRIAITDGSGLSKANRLSARTLATILRAAWSDFEVGPEFVSSLKVMGGEPWLLAWKDPALTRRIRFKTGHLKEVTTLCGYLQDRKGEVRIFAAMLNGKATEAELHAIVQAWAE